MKKEHLQRPETIMVGLTTRTNNKAEADPASGKLFPCIQKYFHQGLAAYIPNRANPGTTICAYTEYESDHTGEYTYFIGEEVTAVTEVPEGMRVLTLPGQRYVKFTNGPGPMPEVVRKPWQQIWEMSPKDFGGDRSYGADFEVYDERASDHEKIVLDIFIGVEKA